VYRQGLMLVNRLTGADVSVHKAERTVAAWGREAEEKAKARVREPESSAERIAATRPIEGLRQCVTVDVAMVQLRCLCASGDGDRFWGFDELWEHIRTLAA